MLFFHPLWNHPWLDGVMIAIAKYGLLVSAGALIVGVARRRAYGALPWAALGAILAVGIDLLGGRLFNDPRPFVVLGVAPLFSHPPDNGFPSDHSAVAAYMATCLWFIDVPSAAVATLAAVAIGVARVYGLVHWPLDVVGGWAIGALPAGLAMLVWRTRYGSSTDHHNV